MLKQMFESFFTNIGNLFFYGYNEPRTYVINNDKKIIYLINSKVACSSVKFGIFSLNNVSDNYSVHTMISNRCFENINLSDYSDYFSFTFVRNPFERLVSCYESKYHSDKKHLNKSINHLWYDYYLFGFLRKDDGFKKFVKKIVLIPERLQDRHFFSQYTLVYGDKNCKCVDYIGKYENIQEEYGKIQKKYNLGYLPQFNPSNKGNWMDYYDGITARLVYKKYKKDITTFGYEKEYKKLKKYLISKKRW